MRKRHGAPHRQEGTKRRFPILGVFTISLLQGHSTILLTGGFLSGNNFDLLDTSNTRDSYHHIIDIIGNFYFRRDAERYVADAPTVTDEDTIP